MTDSYDDPGLADVAARLDYVERQLASLWRQQALGVPYVPYARSSEADPVPGAATAPSGDHDAGLPDDVVALVRAGRKIDAITEYRRLTGKGLKEAKLAVDTVL